MGAVCSQLSFEERRRIGRRRNAKITAREMERVLKRSQAANHRLRGCPGRRMKMLDCKGRTVPDKTVFNI